MKNKRPFIGFNYLLILGCDLEKFCEKWDVEVVESECPYCKEKIIANKPFATIKRRGLVSDSCECGAFALTYIDLTGGLNLL